MPILKRLSLILVLALAAVLRADDSFTKALSPDDFKAAGLDKLTPEELAKLDALIRGEKTVAVAKATEETTQVVTAKVTAQVTAQVSQQVAQQVAAQVTEKVRKEVQAEDKKKEASEGFLSKMKKVVISPGTEIQYTDLDVEIVPGFHGWEKDTIFTLTNGQQWVVTDDERYWADRKDKPVKARIEPGILGSFFMNIDGGGRPKVKFLRNLPGSQAAADAAQK
jgi:hypothetical protein